MLTATHGTSRRRGASVSHPLLLAGVVAALSGWQAAGASSPHRDQAQCGWKVHYDTWLPSFDPVPYEHPGFGEHCLEVCCRDPDCKGLALDSSDSWTCFRYKQLPSKVELAKHPAQPLGDGLWLLHRKQAWNVFEKEAAAPGVPKFHPFMHHSMSWSRRGIHGQGEAPHASMVARPKADPNDCQWEVHYDTWVPTFDKGEYKHSSGGGLHCLEACCRDPTCHGIQMESVELYQCYKYSKSPDLHSRPGRLLGDSRWLLGKKTAWSVFMKAGPLPAGAPGAHQREIALKQHQTFVAAGPHIPHIPHFLHGPHAHFFHPGFHLPHGFEPHRHGAGHQHHVPPLDHAALLARAERAAQRVHGPSQQNLGLIQRTGGAPTAQPQAQKEPSGTSMAQREPFHSSVLSSWVIQLLGIVVVVAFFFQRSGVGVLLPVAMWTALQQRPKERKADCGSHELIDRSLL